MLVFHAVILRGLVGRYQQFGETDFSPEEGAVRYTETPISTYKSTRRSFSGDQHRHLYRRENLVSHKMIIEFDTLHFNIISFFCAFTLNVIYQRKPYFFLLLFSESDISPLLCH
jgi:hypothetical protein